MDEEIKEVVVEATPEVKEEVKPEPKKRGPKPKVKVEEPAVEVTVAKVEVKPEPKKEASKKEEPKLVIIAGSIAVVKPIRIYLAPVRSDRYSEYVGAFTYEDFNNDFYKVSYKAPGAGTVVTGFVAKTDIM